MCLQAYGKTAYLITTLKRVPRGTEGAVSLEGTAAGIAAAAIFSATALLLKLVCAVDRCTLDQIHMQPHWRVMQHICRVTSPASLG